MRVCVRVFLVCVYLVYCTFLFSLTITHKYYCLIEFNVFARLLFIMTMLPFSDSKYNVYTSFDART